MSRLTFLGQQKGKVGLQIVRHFSNSSRLYASGGVVTAESLNYNDLVHFHSYLKDNNVIHKRKTFKPVYSGSKNDFKFSGKSLSSLIKLNDLSVPEESISSSILPSSEQRGWKFLNQTNTYLKTSRDADLYRVLNMNRQLLPEYISKLSADTISLIIRRITDYQLQLVKEAINEQQFASRIRPDSNVSNLLKEKDRTYVSVKQIVRTIGKSARLHTVDYESVMTFCMENLRFQDALDTLEVMEGEIAKGEDLKLTSLIWAYKIELICGCSERTWRIKRYRLQQNRAKQPHSDAMYSQNTNRKVDVTSLIREYQKENLIPSNEVYGMIILALGKSGKLELLDHFIQSVWKIQPDTGKIDNDDLVLKESPIYPTYKLLSRIFLAYNSNNELLKPIVLCNGIIEHYRLPLNRSQKYWEIVLKATALQCENVFRDIQTALWRNDTPSTEFRGADMPIRRDIFDLLWEYITSVVPKPSKKMIRLRLKYGTLEGLLKDLPVIYKRTIDPHINITVSEAAYNENLLMSYLNQCRVGLCKRHQFFPAEQMIKEYSTTSKMQGILLGKLETYQKRCLQRLGKEREQRKKMLIEDDDDSMLGLW